MPAVSSSNRLIWALSSLSTSPLAPTPSMRMGAPGFQDASTSVSAHWYSSLVIELGRTSFFWRQMVLSAGLRICT